MLGHTPILGSASLRYPPGIGRMNLRRHNPGTVLLVAALAAGVLVAASSALASVLVYQNGFPNKSRAGELIKAEGSHCEKEWRSRQEVIAVTVKRGPDACGYRPPVEGLGSLPDQDLRARMKVLNETPKGLRDDVYVAIAVRSSKEKGYELRIFPKGKRYELRRRPAGGPFPDEGTDTAIRGINRANILRLRAEGNRVRAYVNGTLLADVNDPNPGEVGGQKLEVIVGNRRDTSRNAFGLFDDVKVAVPNP
jgi:hypothetical protein